MKRSYRFVECWRNWKRPMLCNGLMIDCCRILEKQEYYYRLIDFMADWKMSHLQLHFSDNHGFAIDLPGFSHLAMPHAFSAGDIEKLCAYAAAKQIDIVPELETFGHTQFLTDHPDYRHLFAGYQKTRGGQKGGGINPLNPEGAEVIRRLIDEVVRIFPSNYFHLGCDEVNMDDFLSERGLNGEEVWAGYVNDLIGYARGKGKTPIIWADKLKKTPGVAQYLRKDVCVMEWDYEDKGTDEAIRNLRNHGFEEVMASPSVMFLRYRIFPTEIAFNNTRRVVQYAVDHDLSWVMNTVWCPHRYLSGTLYYAVAYGAHLVAHKGQMDMKVFRDAFSYYMFAEPCPPALGRFLDLWPQLNLRGDLAKILVGEFREVSGENMREMKTICDLGEQALAHASQFSPGRNQPVWFSMVLSARIAKLCAECYFVQEKSAAQIDSFRGEFDRVIEATASEWDETRYPDDPHKWRPHFTEPESSYLLPFLVKLREKIGEDRPGA